MKSKNSIQDIKSYLRKNNVSETFLYNNRLFLNHYIKADEYEKNRMFILKYRSITMNKNF